MKIIIPMAGIGKRMRPHTLAIPKPLLPVAGKPIVQHLAEDISRIYGRAIEEVVFVTGHFGEAAEGSLLKIAELLGAKGSICYQEKALGTAHAILCAGDTLKGPVIVAFADTLFEADFKPDANADGIIWVHKVKDPTNFGVVKLNKKNIITDFVEKSDTFISDLAIIGIYYFKDGGALRKELQYLIDNHIRDNGEYQLTSALENMKNKGCVFIPGEVTKWLDCGNKDAMLHTNMRILERNEGNNLISPSFLSEHTVVIKPCFIGKDVKISHSVIGPYVSVGDHSVIDNSVIKNSIIQNYTIISNAHLDNSMIGSHVQCLRRPEELSIGDYSCEKVS